MNEKYAFVFPGQGSQAPGMLADIKPHFPVISEIFAEAGDILGFDLWKLTRDGAAMNRTENTQPLMLAADYAIFRVLEKTVDLSPVAMAGHSLGEFSALVAAGSMDFADAVKLVQKRAQIMLEASPENSVMAAVLGLDAETVGAICKSENNRGTVEAVNFNAPGQTVIAGAKNTVERAVEKMKNAGAKRVVILPVGVISHCSMMQTAAEKLHIEINHVKIRPPQVKILHNVDAEAAENIDAMRDKLSMQLQKPVLWTQTIGAMKNMGAEKIIELGPGKVLTNLTKRIDGSIKTRATNDLTALQTVLREFEK